MKRKFEGQLVEIKSRRSPGDKNLTGDALQLNCNDQEQYAYASYEDLYLLATAKKVRAVKSDLKRSQNAKNMGMISNTFFVISHSPR
jgi:hypothetical protein